VAQERGAAEWYRVLDPLRAYALEKLQRSGDELRAQSRHRDWYVHLAERFETAWRGSQQRVWFDSLEREVGNIRVALRGCLDRGDIIAGLRIAGALPRFWDLRGRLTEGREWLAELLRVMGPSTPDSVTAKALGAAGYLAAYQGDTQQAEAQLTEALRLWRGLGNGNGVASTLIALGTTAAQSDNARAESLWSEGLAAARSAGDRVDTYWALHLLGGQATRQGDYGRAQALHEEGLLLKQQQGDGVSMASSLYGLAQVEWLRNDHERALKLLREGLALIQDLGHWRAIAQHLQLLAHVTADCGEAERSACLFGAVEALQENLGDRRSVPVVLNINPARTEASIAACRVKLMPIAFEAAWRKGQAMTTDEAVAFALSATAADTALRSTSSHDSGLTERETEVLRLVAEGKSNQQIAATLVLSRRTVERHIANLCSKVGAHNRVEATAYALRSGIA
jgi:ATP/maltotriose-dependent transcriptional regulator MalT